VIIQVRYHGIDSRRSRLTRFRTLAGAQRYAQKWVGKYPEVSLNFGYAVSSVGVGKITVKGCPIRALFPEREAPKQVELEF
jgi:hypothetical protein